MASNASKSRKSETSPGRTGSLRTRPAKAVGRREVILGAATKRFAEHGYEATTVRQIADDVNLLSGSLYHHFATKDEMLHEIVRDAVFKMRENSIRISRAATSAEHRFIALILLDLGELTRNQEVHAILANDRKLFRQNPEFAYVAQAKKDTYLAWRTVLERGVKDKQFKADLDPYLTISTTLRMLNVAADWYKNDDARIAGNVGKYSLNRVIDFYLEYILGAVRLPARAGEPIDRKACEALAVFRT